MSSSFVYDTKEGVFSLRRFTGTVQNVDQKSGPADNCATQIVSFIPHSHLRILQNIKPESRTKNSSAPHLVHMLCKEMERCAVGPVEYKHQLPKGAP